MPRPTLCTLGKDDDTVQVVGHDHKGIQVGVWKMLGQRLPGSLNQLSLIAELHLLMLDLAQPAFPVVHADGHKIRTR